MVDPAEIEYLLNTYFENAMTEDLFSEDDYVVAADGSVETYTDVSSKKLMPNGRLPLKFGVVDGNFSVAGAGLQTLLHSPTRVIGTFDCSGNKLTSLAHSPKSVISFQCSNNQLTTLSGCPKVSDELWCDNNLLTSLETLPEASWVWATDNPFEHFRNTPSHINTVTVSWNQTLPLLGLLSVQKIQLVDPATDQSMESLEEILNQYAGKGQQGAIACAAELAKAGFKGNARW